MSQWCRLSIFVKWRGGTSQLRSLVMAATNSLPAMIATQSTFIIGRCRAGPAQRIATFCIRGCRKASLGAATDITRH